MQPHNISVLESEPIFSSSLTKSESSAPQPRSRLPTVFWVMCTGL